MFKSDVKILELIAYLKYKGVVSSNKDFCSKIDMLHTTITKIKKGEAHFTALHIERICKVYKVNANWIFGIETKIFNTT